MNGHYALRIEVTKVEFEETKTGNNYDRNAKSVETRRVVSDAGRIEIKNTNFEAAKSLAAQHLALLVEFTGTDPRKGNTRDA